MPAAEDTVRRIRDAPGRWADQVHRALLRLLAGREVAPGDGVVQVLRSRTAVEDGRPVLYLVYSHPWWTFPTGLRRRLDGLDEHPLDAPIVGVDPAEDLAWAVVVTEVEEPLGTVAPSMVPDADGVWWWGDPPLPGDLGRRGPAPGAGPRT